MDSVVCFLWNNGFRAYTPEHVNMLAHACRRFLKRDHRFICVTDQTAGFCDHVEVFTPPPECWRLGSIPAPNGKTFPSCYRRLWLLSPEAMALGDRILLLDVDCAILGDLDALFEVDADFVGWCPRTAWGKRQRLGGGTWLHKTGTLAWLWGRFTTDRKRMIEETKRAGWNGSDQAILSRFLREYPVWPRDSGIYGTQDGVMSWQMPPEDARIVHFNSSQKMWGQPKLWMKAYCNHFRGCP